MDYDRQYLVINVSSVGKRSTWTRIDNTLLSMLVVLVRDQHGLG
jgi:hypothetical protein